MCGTMLVFNIGVNSYHSKHTAKLNLSLTEF